MNKYYEKLKCFFSLNYQLKKIYLLSKQREEFYIDVTLYEYIVNPFLVIKLLKIFLYKKSTKPLSSYTPYGYRASIPYLRKYFILSFKISLFFQLVLCTTIVLCSSLINQPFYIWILVFLLFIMSNLTYYMYSKRNEVFFLFCTACDDDEQNFFEEWLNAILIRFENDNIKNIIVERKLNRVRKRL